MAPSSVPLFYPAGYRPAVAQSFPVVTGVNAGAGPGGNASVLSIDPDGQVTVADTHTTDTAVFIGNVSFRTHH